MKLLRLNALATDLQLPETAVTIGNFDGVHRGHQAMLGLLDRHPEGAEIDPRQLALDGLQLGDELITEARSKLLEVANG